MDRQTELALIDRLRLLVESGEPAMADDEARLDTAVYRSPERFAEERRVLFRRQPIIVGHSSAVAAPGDVLTHDLLDVPLFVTRDRDGVLRAFLNVCRHRGSRLVVDEHSHGRKALVCGYHGWTYGLDGGLMHIPHPAGFPRTDCDRSLVPLAVEARAGFIWVVPTPGVPMELDAFLGPLAQELESFGINRDVARRTANVRRRFNWKLMIDAFLDGYHIRQLHRNSVYRFFLDNLNLVDTMPPHIRSVVARKEMAGAARLPREEWRYRELLSLTYFVFPNTVLVFHPDWVSRITLFPVSPVETVFTHTMIVPADRSAEEHEAHWEKTWRLIHETVFEREDLVAAEWIQGGLEAGANETFALGRYEHVIKVFHDTIASVLDAHRVSSG